MTQLLQSGLFSAVVTAFLAISVQTLQPDPQEKPTSYLENIYQLLADPNRTHVPTLPSQFNPPAFSPPKSAVWVISLWFLSLVVTLSCALLAILVQQWVRRYIKLAHQHSASGPLRRARTRAIFHKGVEDLNLQRAVDALPILLHASLVLFLAGLVVFSFGYNPTVCTVVVSWVGLGALTYACFTLLPLFRHDSPYYTPISPPLWLLYTGTLSLAVRILRWFTAFNCFSDKTWGRFGRLKDHYGRRFSHRIEEAAEEFAQNLLPEIDGGILLWVLQSLDEDHVLQGLFGAIPDFRSSRVLEKFRNTFQLSNGEKMTEALIGLMDRTLPPDQLMTKADRIQNYIQEMAALSLPINRQTLSRVLYNDWDGLLGSVEFGLLLRKASYSDAFAKYYSQCVVSVIIAKADEHDDRWFELATGQLGLSKSTLETYLAHGDTVLLANCIFICQRTVETYSEHSWHRDVYSRSKTLESVSGLVVQDALPELKRKFCYMWNKLVRNTGDQLSRDLSIYILKHIRNVYFELHRDTIAAPIAFTDTTPDSDSILLFPSSYPSCMIGCHHSKPSPEEGNDVGEKRSEVSPSPITTLYGDSMLISSKKESPLSDVPLLLQNSTLVATPTHTRATPVQGGSQCLPPDSPSMIPFHLIHRGAGPHVTSFRENSTNITPSPPSNPLRVRDHRTETTSNSSETTHDATAQVVHTSSNASHTGIPAVSQQRVLIAPPPRAILRNDGSRLNGPLELANNTHDTTITSVSSTATPIPHTSGAVSALPHSSSLTATHSPSGSVASHDGAALHISPAHAAAGIPSPALPISVSTNTIPTYTQLSPIPSMSRSDHTPSGMRQLMRDSFTYSNNNRRRWSLL
jgi:hypothetical protein